MSSGGLDAVRQAIVRAAGSYRYRVVQSEQGTIVSVGDGVAQVAGLSAAVLGEVLRFESGGVGIALDLGRDEIGVILLCDDGNFHAGEAVLMTGEVMTTPVGPELLGRVVDPLGSPLDGGGASRTRERLPVERPAPGIIDREAINAPLHTGITAIDALLPVGRGQRELIIGDRGTGKTTLAVEAILAQRETGVKCVYVSIGQQASEVLSVIETLRQSGAFEHTIVVSAPAEAPPGIRYLAPYAACSIAEYFRDRGEDALLVLDDLTLHAVAYREISLLLRRPPGREAYPGDIFYVHSRLLERATRLSRQLGGGSLTALPIAETQAGRISGFIPTNLISITDGQIYLDPQLFDAGFKPAVDIGQSVSRVGGKGQSSGMKAVAGRLRLDLARFRELEVFSRFGARIEEETQKLLVRGARAREVLKQLPAAPISLGEQIAILVVLEDGLFDLVPVARVADLVVDFRAALRDERSGHRGLLRKLESGGVDPSVRVAVHDALERAGLKP